MTTPAGDPRPARPVRFLIGALGGEGGGVLAQWLVSAANRANLPVQGTSLPGTSQRTGATTYYVEMLPAPAPAGKAPVFSLYPAGALDLVAASELVELGRMIEAGHVGPEKTVLIGSTHRILTIGERKAMSDGRFDTSTVEKAAHALSKRLLLANLEEVASASGSRVNAVLFGLIAGSGVYPVGAGDCRRTIEEAGVAVAASLAGFEAGLGLWDAQAAPEAAASPKGSPAGASSALTARIEKEFSPALSGTLREGVRQLSEYQDGRYAAQYLDRLAPVLKADDADAGAPLTLETARRLAVWMAYDDVIRVAQIKTSRARFSEVRAEVGAAPGQTLHIIDYLRPGLEELASVLPKGLGAMVMRRATRRGARSHHGGLHIRTTSLSGFLLMRALAAFRPWRRRTYRFDREQSAIERWLAAVAAGGARAPELGLEIARCAGLIKGYGDTHTRGSENIARLFANFIDPALRCEADARAAASDIAAAREAALADPDGHDLDALVKKRNANSGGANIGVAAD
jgi:indolepyruvate ferredoxin oxidoreductase beta subunit